MDLTESLAPKSDQLDADDLLTGPRTFTIAEVTQGPSAEQPFNFKLAEFPRPFRPSKTVRRIIVAAWGPHAEEYVGRRMTLYRDPTVKFGGEAVGGIRVSHLSHLKDGKPLRVSLLIAKGRKAPFTVQPLTEARVPDYPKLVAEATAKDDLNVLWRSAAEAGHLTEDLKAAIIARVAEIDAATAEPEDEPTLPTDGGDQS